MKVHEYQAKQLLARHGLSVPLGIPVLGADSLDQAIQEVIGTSKSQTPAIDQDARVQFARDGHTLLDEQALDHAALGPGLVGGEAHAQDLPDLDVASSDDPFRENAHALGFTVLPAAN